MHQDDDPAGDSWELAPGNAHPAAVAALSEPWYWDSGDEISPFGNDTGADVLSLLHQWRQESPDASPMKLLKQLLADWGVPDAGWDDLDPGHLGKLRRAEDYGVSMRDDMIIALAFGQVVLEGRLDPEVRRYAITAVRRLLLPVMLERYGANLEEARTRLQHMLGVLEKPWPE